jgi:hypothetical protein
MMAKLGHKVRDLTRIKMGPLTLEGLKPGAVRPLSHREVNALRKVAIKDHSKGREQSGNDQPERRGKPRTS